MRHHRDNNTQVTQLRHTSGNNETLGGRGRGCLPLAKKIITKRKTERLPLGIFPEDFSKNKKKNRTKKFRNRQERRVRSARLSNCGSPWAFLPLDKRVFRPSIYLKFFEKIPHEKAVFAVIYIRDHKTLRNSIMNALINKVKNRPGIFAELFRATILLAISFGLVLSTAQVASIMVVVSLALTLLTDKVVTPDTKVVISKDDEVYQQIVAMDEEIHPSAHE